MARVELEIEKGEDIKTFSLKEGERVYWTKLPKKEGDLRIEYMVWVAQDEAIIASRSKRSRRFRPTRIGARDYGTEFGLGEPGDRFSLKVFSEEEK